MSNPSVGGEQAPSLEARPHRSRFALLRAIDRMNEALLVVLSLVLGLCAALGIVQVVARYIIHAPLVWSEEVIRFTLIWSVFLGAGIAARKGMLVAVEAVYIVVPPAVARVIEKLSLAISAAFWIVLIVFGWSISGRVQGMLSGSLELPMSYVYLAIPIGALVALVNTIAVAIDPPPPVLTQAAS